MKQELAVVKKKRGMDGGEEKGKHFFFRSLCGNETLQKAEWQTVQESKRGQLLGEKQEWQRLRESDGKTIADRKIYRSETAVVQHPEWKKKNAQAGRLHSSSRTSVYTNNAWRAVWMSAPMCVLVRTCFCIHFCCVEAHERTFCLCLHVRLHVCARRTLE